MKRHSSILFSWFAALVIVLAGCTAVLPSAPAAIESAQVECTPTQSASAGAAPAEQEAEATAPTEATELPSVLRIATAGDLGLLDPAFADPRNEATSTVLRAVYQTLVTYDPDEFVEIAPGLAETWEFNDDYTELTFHLRQDAYFADGDKVTADDVVFSFERLKSIGGPPAFLAETIESIEKVDDSTVTLKLTQPDPGISGQIGHRGFQHYQQKTSRGTRGGFSRFVLCGKRPVCPDSMVF